MQRKQERNVLGDKRNSDHFKWLEVFLRHKEEMGFHIVENESVADTVIV